MRPVTDWRCVLSAVCSKCEWSECTGGAKRGPRGRFAHEYTHRHCNRKARGAAMPAEASIRSRTTRHSHSTASYSSDLLGCYGAPPPLSLVIISYQDDTAFPNPDRLTGFQVALLLPLTGTVVGISCACTVLEQKRNTHDDPAVKLHRTYSIHPGTAAANFFTIKRKLDCVSRAFLSVSRAS